MSKAQWGDRIPQIVEVNENDQPVDRWMVNGKVRSEWVCNCPAAMEGGVERGYYPRRWEEVPKIVYDPAERLKALDEDRVDGEVLYPNGPISNFAFLQGDAAFELACVQAYNDALAEWRAVSDRYVPVAIIPYMSEIDVVVAEVERCVKRGHRGVVMLAEPAFTKMGLKRMNDPYWEPLWACCQELGRIHQERISYGFNLAAVRDTGAINSQSDLLRHSRPLSAAQLGLRRNGIRLGQLRTGSVQS
jgi:predicted TIM-barrel fold metal-dependent hydrolase